MAGVFIRERSKRYGCTDKRKARNKGHIKKDEEAGVKQFPIREHRGPPGASRHRPEAWVQGLSFSLEPLEGAGSGGTLMPSFWPLEV